MSCLTDQTNFYRKEGSTGKDYNSTREWLTPSFLTPILEQALNCTVDRLDPDISARKRPMRIIEGGCGTGRFTLPLFDLFKEISPDWLFWGVDNSKQMLKPAYEQFNTMDDGLKNHIRYGEMCLNQPFIFHNGFFDIFILASVIQCLMQYQNTLDEINRVMHEKGFIWVAWRNDEWLKLLSGCEYAPKNLDGFLVGITRAFHEYRKEFGVPVDERARLQYDPSPAFDYLGEKGWKLIKKIISTAREDITTSKLRMSFEKGLNTGTGSGLPEGVREKIYQRLRTEYPELEQDSHVQQVEVKVNLAVLGRD